MGLQEDGSTYCLSRWPPLPYFHLLEDNGHGCCDDTVELKALCPHSEFHWESHQLHLDHRTSTRSPVKGKAWGWGHRTSFLFFLFFFTNDKYHSSLSFTVNTEGMTMDWPPSVHLLQHLFVCSFINNADTADESLTNLRGMMPLTTLVWHFQNYTNWFRGGGATLFINPGHHAHNFTHWWSEKFEGACGVIFITQVKGGTTIRDYNDMLAATLSLIDVVLVRGIVTWWALAAKPRPSCLHTTMASLMPQFSLQTEPQRLRPPTSINTSTRPSEWTLPPASRTWTSIRLQGLNGWLVIN